MLLQSLKPSSCFQMFSNSHCWTYLPIEMEINQLHPAYSSKKVKAETRRMIRISEIITKTHILLPKNINYYSHSQVTACWITSQAEHDFWELIKILELRQYGSIKVGTQDLHSVNFQRCLAKDVITSLRDDLTYNKHHHRYGCKTGSMSWNV
jgi:hypothetical protein